MLKDANGYTDENMARALAQYERVKGQLEAEHLNAYVTIDAVHGDYAIASTALESRLKFKALHGQRTAFTLHIGTT